MIYGSDNNFLKEHSGQECWQTFNRAFRAVSAANQERCEIRNVTGELRQNRRDRT
jgi:hypothetical protein